MVARMFPLLPAALIRPVMMAAVFVLGSASAWAAAATGSRGMVASVHPLATQIGVEVLKNGGNAIDAAVAVGLALGVVDGHNSGIGGGAFILVRRANGEIVALDGREMAPATASRDMYLRNGKADTALSQTGALASGVPGALAVYDEALRLMGRKKLAELIEPSARIADEGFALSEGYVRRIRSVAESLAKFPASRALLLKPDGTALDAGTVLRQPDLARSYRAIGREGIGWFYRGEYARAVEAWMRAHGGILTAGDFAGYEVKRRQPIVSTYRGHTIVGFGPPSSGGVHVAQILNMLETFDVKALGADGERQHVIAEAMKLAFADRAHWLGDPDFAQVPRGLLEKSYARALAAKIDRRRAIAVAGHGVPPDADPRFFEKHTTHFSVADAEGNWVACTQTVNTAFGSKVIVPGTGIILNNEMDDFSVEPGVPNAFKLIGAEANAIAPKKRPLSSMSPTIVLRDGQPVLALGAAGGPTIITQVLLNLVAILDLGMTVDAAIKQPRIHQQWRPDELRIEQALPASVRAALTARGHTLAEVNSMGVSQIVGRAPDGRGFVGVGDPRVNGSAAGW